MPIPIDLSAATHFIRVIWRFYWLWGWRGLPCAVHMAWSATQQIADLRKGDYGN